MLLRAEKLDRMVGTTLWSSIDRCVISIACSMLICFVVWPSSRGTLRAQACPPKRYMRIDSAPLPGKCKLDEVAAGNNGRRKAQPTAKQGAECHFLRECGAATGPALLGNCLVKHHGVTVVAAAVFMFESNCTRAHPHVTL